MNELFANAAQTTLFGSIDNVTVTVVVTSSSLFPAAVTGVSQFRVLCGAEIMLVTNVASTTWTVTRGAEGTTAVTHANGAAITHVLTSGAIANLPGLVKSFNTRLGDIVLVKTDVTGTNLTSADVGAVSASGGGREDSVVDLNVSGAYTIDVSRGNHFELHLSGNVTTLNMPIAGQTPNDGLYSFTLEVFYNGHTITAVDSRVTWLATGSTMPSLDTTSDLFGFYENRDNTNWRGIHSSQKSQYVGSYIELDAAPQPAQPASGKVRVWVNNTDQHLKSINGTGTVIDYNTGGSGSGGAAPQISSVAGQEAFVQTGGSPMSASMSSAVTVNNLLVAVVGSDRYSSPTITPASGFQLAKRLDSANGIGFIAIYYHIATATTSSFTFSYSGGGGNFGGTTSQFLWVQEYTGNETNETLVLDRHGSYDSPDNTGFQWDMATNGPSGSGVTTRANELAIVGALFGYVYGDAPTWGTTGFANARVLQKGTVGVKLLTATGVVNAHAKTDAHTNYFSGVIATFKAAAP